MYKDKSMQRIKARDLRYGDRVKNIHTQTILTFDRTITVGIHLVYVFFNNENKEVRMNEDTIFFNYEKVN